MMNLALVKIVGVRKNESMEMFDAKIGFVLQGE